MVAPLCSVKSDHDRMLLFAWLALVCMCIIIHYRRHYLKVAFGLMSLAIGADLSEAADQCLVATQC